VGQEAGQSIAGASPKNWEKKVVKSADGEQSESLPLAGPDLYSGGKVEMMQTETQLAYTSIMCL
jgi:hypothetical protein